MRLTNLHNEARISAIKIAVPAAVIVLIATATLASFHWRRSIPTVTTAAKTSSHTTLVQQRDELRSERITLRPTGFEPDVITRPVGRFLLAVNDRTGRSDTTIKIVGETGQQLHAVALRDNPRKHEWRKVLSLPPGRYVISEANHPEWTCRIVLTPN